MIHLSPLQNSFADIKSKIRMEKLFDVFVNVATLYDSKKQSRTRENKGRCCSSSIFCTTSRVGLGRIAPVIASCKNVGIAVSSSSSSSWTTLSRFNTMPENVRTLCVRFTRHLLKKVPFFPTSFLFSSFSQSGSTLSFSHFGGFTNKCYYDILVYPCTIKNGKA